MAWQVLFRPAVITTLTMNAHTAPNAEIPSSTSAKMLILQITNVYGAVIIIITYARKLFYSTCGIIYLHSNAKDSFDYKHDG